MADNGTGAIPGKMNWGYARGKRMMRRAVKEAAGGAAARTCTTIMLYQSYGKAKTRPYGSERSSAKNVAKPWATCSPSMMSGIAHVWRGLEQKKRLGYLSGRAAVQKTKSGWRCVKGPISAWRRSLQDLGRKTLRATYHVDEQLQQHRINGNLGDGLLNETLIRAIQTSVERQLWSEAAEGYDGSGITNPSIDEEKRSWTA